MKKTAAGFPDDDDKRPLTDEERELLLMLGGDDSLAEVARQIASEDEENPL
jgi:hypothetical protein